MTEALQEPEYRVERSTEVDPNEIIALRAADGSRVFTPEKWQKNLKLSLCTVLARDPTDRRLIGIGFVSGNAFHAELVDLTVHPDYRQQGIATLIGAELLNYVNEEEIEYVGLTYDESKPWLRDFYAKGGFVPINNAMWLERSIDLANGSQKE